MPAHKTMRNKGLNTHAPATGPVCPSSLHALCQVRKTSSPPFQRALTCHTIEIRHIKHNVTKLIRRPAPSVCPHATPEHNPTISIVRQGIATRKDIDSNRQNQPKRTHPFPPLFLRLKLLWRVGGDHPPRTPTILSEKKKGGRTEHDALRAKKQNQNPGAAPLDPPWGAVKSKSKS
ncbi:MAG: hypothetical protein HW380_1591, partial [Magnetococcales bacterium]|nr:hypothetical protein [Magnetococcales bacterium]